LGHRFLATGYTSASQGCTCQPASDPSGIRQGRLLAIAPHRLKGGGTINRRTARCDAACSSVSEREQQLPCHPRSKWTPTVTLSKKNNAESGCGRVSQAARRNCLRVTLTITRPLFANRNASRRRGEQPAAFPKSTPVMRDMLGEPQACSDAGRRGPSQSRVMVSR